MITTFKSRIAGMKNKEDKSLKQCPFCGGAAELDELSGRWAVVCVDNCVGTRLFNDKQKAIDIWNKRA